MHGPAIAQSQHVWQSIGAVQSGPLSLDDSAGCVLASPIVLSPALVEPAVVPEPPELPELSEVPGAVVSTLVLLTVQFAAPVQPSSKVVLSPVESEEQPTSKQKRIVRRMGGS
jgi:hypothetical protein